VRLGTCPDINGGLLITVLGTAEFCVMIEEVELERAGDEGRALTKEAAAGGDGAASEPAESR